MTLFIYFIFKYKNKTKKIKNKKNMELVNENKYR